MPRILVALALAASLARSPAPFLDFFSSLWSEPGPQLDPNGSPAPQTDEGPELDPNGAPAPQSDEGSHLDPDGCPGPQPRGGYMPSPLAGLVCSVAGCG